MSHVLKSKMRIRNAVLDALSYGADGKKRSPSNGMIFRLLKKLDSQLDYLDPGDIDGLKKITDATLKLAALALPTAAQSEAIDKGIAPTNPGAMGNDLLNLLESHLVQRRAILARTLQPTESVVIDSIPNLSELAKVELSKRHASLTPPPAPGEGGVRGEIGGRAPTVSHTPTISPMRPIEIQVGTKNPSHPTRDVDELDFSE